MPPLLYHNFELLIERNGDSYRAHVTASPEGEGNTYFDLPALTGNDHQAIGEELYHALFANTVATCLTLSWQKSQQDHKGLRIRLRLYDTAPELATLPWELLYSSEWQRFLVLSTQTPLVRYIPLARNDPPLAVVAPLRILAVIATPSDLAEVDGEKEWQRLCESLADLSRQALVVIERLDPATPTALQDRLRKRDVNLLHFSGHGYFDQHNQEGGVYFEDETGQKVPITASQLATLLGDGAPRLVFLNACEGATSGATNIFAGVAQKLVQQGIPAVIAMQTPITDVNALHLSHTFYKALADGYPVDAVLAEARKAIFTAGSYPELAEWAAPILFSRSPDNQLFPAPTPDEPTITTWVTQPFEPETVVIGAGKFIMGNDGVSEEAPQRTLDLPAYRIGVTPVTNRQYAEFLKTNPAQAVPDKRSWFMGKPVKAFLEHPVVNVSWHEAQAYCNWLSAASGRQYQLPSEAEWEKAARGTDGRIYPWGNDWQEKCANIGGTTTMPVTAFAEGTSPFGCLDMLGNVQEWTSSVWNEEDPPTAYVIRGGSYRSQPEEVRCSSRDGIHPDSKVAWRGFRVVAR